MAIKVLMPALSPTMTEGTLAKWHKKVGDKVEAGDVIAEIETDKATMEVEAVDEGTLGRILIEEGTEGVPVNEVIAVLLEEGEDDSAIDALDVGGGSGGAGSGTESGSAPKEEAAPAAAPETAPAEPAPPGSGGGAGTGGSGGPDGSRVFASPLAKRMAQQAGLDLGSIRGSGPNGRIVKADVEKAMEAGGARREAPAPSARPAVSWGERPAPTEVPLSGVRKVIATRLSEADRDVPQFYLTVDCEIDSLLETRKLINDAADGAYKVSVNDLVLKAVACALRKVPKVNAQWGGDRILEMNTVDIAVAVAYDGGLITPIITDADRKGVGQISEEMKELAGRAREGRLKPEEYQGGGFSVSNLGMYGIKHFTSIINPPSACILAVGAGEQRPVVKNGQLAVATVMSVTLTCDHRVVDGALGSQWLQAFKGFIEKPATMIA